MFKLISVLIGASVLLAVPLFGQSTLPGGNTDETVDPRAGVIEYLPPAAVEQSASAGELIDRTLHKHELLLRSRRLMMQVLGDPKVGKLQWVKQQNCNEVADKLTQAVKVRILPKTNLIQIVLDPNVVTSDSRALTEAIINQYLEDQQQSKVNKQLERSISLNNLKNRYQFRKDDLQRDLREKAVQLAVDGIGQPGRLSAKEVELNNILQLRVDLEKKSWDATTDDAKQKIQKERKLLDERVDAAKADLGALTNAMNQYLTLKDDAQTNSEQLKRVNDQLEQIQVMNNVDNLELQWACHPSE